jgi:hypothetical protein
MTIQIWRYLIVGSLFMLSFFRPYFEVVKEGRILKDDFSFLLPFKVFDVKSSFAKPHPFPSLEIVTEATKISLVTFGKLQDLALLQGFWGFYDNLFKFKRRLVTVTAKARFIEHI